MPRFMIFRIPAVLRGQRNIWRLVCVGRWSFPIWWGLRK